MNMKEDFKKKQVLKDVSGRPVFQTRLNASVCMCVGVVTALKVAINNHTRISTTMLSNTSFQVAGVRITHERDRF